MPDSHGLDTITRLCAAVPAVPILVMTGLTDEHIATEAVRCGAEDYLIKGQTDARSMARAIHYAIDRKGTRKVLRVAKEAAEAANVAKSQFLANMSHELRTPMNAILGMTDLALAEPLAPILRDYLQTVKQSADGLLELLNEILDLSRIEGGGFHLEATPFDLRQTVQQVVKTLGVRAAEKGLELACDLADVPNRLVGDPLRLRQVLVNLVGNALKFTPQGKVAVTAAVHAQEAAEVVLEFAVADTGIGITAADHERILRRSARRTPRPRGNTAEPAWD